MVCKSRYWGFLVYPDELKKLGILNSWVQILEDSYEWIAISPLHDKDLISKGDRVGEFVKPHYHVLFVAPNSTTSARAVKLAESVGVPEHMVICINSGLNYYYYLDHSRENDKVLYDHKDIILLNHLDESELKILTKAEEDEFKVKSIAYIVDNHILEYADLLENLMKEDLSLFTYCYNHTLVLTSFITSYRNKQKFKEVLKK